MLGLPVGRKGGSRKVAPAQAMAYEDTKDKHKPAKREKMASLSQFKGKMPL